MSKFVVYVEKQCLEMTVLDLNPLVRDPLYLVGRAKNFDFKKEGIIEKIPMKFEKIIEKNFHISKTNRKQNSCTNGLRTFITNG